MGKRKRSIIRPVDSAALPPKSTVYAAGGMTIGI
jgi:hypothetical protein